MLSKIRLWLDGRRRQAERAAFARGYAFGLHAVESGKYSPQVLLAFAAGTFNRNTVESAFDRGVSAAAYEMKGKQNV